MLQESEGQERVTDKSFPPNDSSLYVTTCAPSAAAFLRAPATGGVAYCSRRVLPTLPSRLMQIAWRGGGRPKPLQRTAASDSASALLGQKARWCFRRAQGHATTWCHDAARKGERLHGGKRPARRRAQQMDEMMEKRPTYGLPRLSRVQVLARVGVRSVVALPCLDAHGRSHGSTGGDAMAGTGTRPRRRQTRR